MALGGGVRVGLGVAIGVGVRVGVVVGVEEEVAIGRMNPLAGALTSPNCIAETKRTRPGINMPLTINPIHRRRGSSASVTIGLQDTLAPRECQASQI